MLRSRSRSSRVQEIAEQAMERVAPVLDDAKERLAPYVDEARTQANEKLIPAAESAAGSARSTFDHTIAPQVGAALAAASAASEPYRTEARRRGTATVAALKGDVDRPAEKKHRLRTLVMLLGLGAAVAFVIKKLTGDGGSAEAWQSDYSAPQAVPDPAAPAAPAAPAGDQAGDEAGDGADGADDAGAAAPDEALSDAAEEPHAPTDPDHPLEHKDVS
ncbi:MAG: hypothetical protein GEU96_09555 [Propionibacteriales bacterium]|nr:hypothetical protein [Propionibacteriales bacterium]